MKLKEKLVEEWVRSHDDWDHKNSGEAYLSGFEKARELVLKLCDDCDESDPMVKDGYYFNDSIKNLGEEEVE
jgi:hypothetical protein